MIPGGKKSLFGLLLKKVYPIKHIVIQTFILITILYIKLKRHKLVIVIEQKYAGFFAQLSWLVYLIYYCKKLNLKPMIYLRDPRYNTGPTYFDDLLKSRFETNWREDKSLNNRIIRIKLPTHLPFFQRIVRNMSYENEKDIISKYLQPSPRIQDAVTSYIVENRLDNYIGIHFRCTDKHREASTVLVEKFLQEINRQTVLFGKPYRNVFIASDSDLHLNEILDLISREFPQLRCKSYNALRSEANLSVLYAREFSINEQIRLGDEALIECLILSRGQVLIRNVSHLSNFSVYFNSNLDLVNLNKPYNLENSFPNLKSYLRILGEDYLQIC